ncbi:MAG: lytic transglycosylase domain-containing protein [Edaphobacter sp.]
MVTMRLSIFQRGMMMLAFAYALCPLMYAAEHVTLRNGFELDCVRSEAIGNKVRLYLPAKDSSTPGSISKDANYLEIAADTIVRTETIEDAPQPLVALKAPAKMAGTDTPTKTQLREMLAHAGSVHHIDTDLLASVIRAESSGQVRAVSRTGARGLMQLMPRTASQMGVQDAFLPEQNIAGGTAYLDELLTRYHDNIALALAAYNAGPAAVDRYHGIPPYRETKEYVARVIREFNRRKQMSLVAQAR